MRHSIISVVILFFLGCTNTKESSDTTPPNVIIIMTDDQGYQDVGCFGSPDILTPNLDQMAKDGIKLTHFYAAQAVCTASRAGLLTGCYPNRLGLHGALMPDSPIGLHPDETTIADMLKKQGYSTGIFGKWHLGDQPEFMPTNQGFDEFFGIPYSNDMWPHHPNQDYFNFDPLLLYQNNQVIDTLNDQSGLTTQITEQSVDFIKRNAANPFFLYVAHPQPHVPLFVSEKFQGKSERGLYGDVIMEIDWSVGQILNQLNQSGLSENTIVIFTSDNGPWLAYGDHAGSADPLREGKGTAWEGGHREPFIMRYPKLLNGGRTISSPVMSIDLLPTIAELTHSSLPEKVIDGMNIWPVLTGQVDKSPQLAYFCYYKQNELQSVRMDEWKLYFPHTYRTLKGRQGGQNGLPVIYEQENVEEIELYNLVSDPSETNNIAQEYSEVVATIQKYAEDMRQKLGDELTNVVGTENREPGRVQKPKEL
ncbi:MAG: sulfatase [Marinoscillum sp.]